MVTLGSDRCSMVCVGMFRSVVIVTVLRSMDPSRGASSSRWMRLWWPGSCCLVSWACSYEGIAGYGMEKIMPSAYRVSRVVSVWWSRGLAGVFRAAQMPVLEV